MGCRLQEGVKPSQHIKEHIIPKILGPKIPGYWTGMFQSYLPPKCVPDLRWQRTRPRDTTWLGGTHSDTMLLTNPEVTVPSRRLQPVLQGGFTTQAALSGWHGDREMTCTVGQKTSSPKDRCGRCTQHTQAEPKPPRIQHACLSNTWSETNHAGDEAPCNAANLEADGLQSRKERNTTRLHSPRSESFLPGGKHVLASHQDGGGCTDTLMLPCGKE